MLFYFKLFSAEEKFIWNLHTYIHTYSILMEFILTSRFCKMQPFRITQFSQVVHFFCNVF